MDQMNQALAIRLDDGRTIIAQPRPEDQDYLAQSGGETRITLGSAEFDVQAHGISTELTVDVEGHALTLRLPTAADAEAVRKALIAGTLTATVIAAGAIASMQGAQQSSRAEAPVQPVTMPVQGAPLVQPGFVEDPGIHQDAYQRVQEARADALQGSAGQATTVKPGTDTELQMPHPASASDFAERKERAVDEALSAPTSDLPQAEDSANGNTRRGGPLE